MAEENYPQDFTGGFPAGISRCGNRYVEEDKDGQQYLLDGDGNRLSKGFDRIECVGKLFSAKTEARLDGRIIQYPRSYYRAYSLLGEDGSEIERAYEEILVEQSGENRGKVVGIRTSREPFDITHNAEYEHRDVFSDAGKIESQEKTFLKFTLRG